MDKSLNKSRPIVVCEITYGNELSFSSLAELSKMFPKNYQFFTFDTQKADGRKARRRGAQAKRSGKYQLIPFTFHHQQGQDDIVACPEELVAVLPTQNPE
jgi:hypothetical protein